ncbi:unnamed protein product [Scytosiphon promiscuus]
MLACRGDFRPLLEVVDATTHISQTCVSSKARLQLTETDLSAPEYATTPPFGSMTPTRAAMHTVSQSCLVLKYSRGSNGLRLLPIISTLHFLVCVLSICLCYSVFVNRRKVCLLLGNTCTNDKSQPLLTCTGGQAAMSEHVATVLGAIGLAETITEFVYALALRKSFTPFESIFFLTGGSFELVGELVAVALGMRYVWQANYGSEDFVDNMGVVLKDPIHNLAYPHRDAGVIVTALLAASSVGVMISNVPVLLWATFFPVWGDFSGDVGVRLLLSIVSSLCMSSQFLLQVACKRRGEEIPFWMRTCIFCLKYSLGKGVEVYLLISKSNRLAPDELGKALITFQMIELLSVAVVIARALTSKVYSEATGLAADQALPKAAVIVLRVSGADLQLQTSQNKGIAASLHNRGVALVSKGKWSKAERLLKRALEIWENSHGLDHLDCALALNSLATLFHNEGKYNEAAPLYERSLDIRQRHLGADHPDVATSLNNRALLLKAQGKYEEADPLYLRAIEIWEAALGPDHPEVATGLHNRAGLLESQGKYDEADALYQRALAIDEKVLGPDHPDVASDLNYRAGLLSAQGKYAEAQLLFERALAINEVALGVDHPSTITSRASMAVLYKNQGLFDKASPLLEEVVSAYERVQGHDHPNFASALNNRAELLQSQGKYEEAGPLYDRSLAIREKALGPDHPAVATALNNRAGLLSAQGKYGEADLLYQRALAIDEKVLGPDHPAVATDLNNRAWLLTAQVRAVRIFRETSWGPHLLMNRSVSRGPLPLKNPPLTIQGKYDDAEPLYERSQAIREKMLGPEHPDIAQSLNNRAWLLERQCKHNEALPLFERAVSIRRKTLGESHHSTVDTRISLERVRKHVLVNTRLGTPGDEKQAGPSS